MHFEKTMNLEPCFPHRYPSVRRYPINPSLDYYPNKCNICIGMHRSSDAIHQNNQTDSY